ncbi:MAG TPA: isopeptide-forming domain-containing fimbrial protein [Candidatus Limnocylindria bacterium]|nr:isopeptide-forming domain-containing fimbrial protein [Candidatus Limnocylindria bacterium]
MAAMPGIHTSRRGTALALVLAPLLVLAAVHSVRADHGEGQDTIHKELVAINGQPVTDPEDPSAPPTVTEGDEVTYRITITAGAEGANAAATVEDVYKLDQQVFIGGQGGTCTVVEEGELDNKVTCEVTLDEAGNAELFLTFQANKGAPVEGEGCPTIQNVATVKTDAFEPRPSNQTQIEVCAPEPVEAVATPTPAGGVMADAATAPARDPGLVQLAILLIVLLGLAGLFTTHRFARYR